MINPRRKLHPLDAATTFGGILIVIAQTAYMAIDPVRQPISVMRLQFAIVLIGVLINQIGVWHLGSRMLSPRRNSPLREAIDDFLDLIRRLNQEAVAGEGSADHALEQLHESVERIAKLLPESESDEIEERERGVA